VSKGILVIKTTLVDEETGRGLNLVEYEFYYRISFVSFKNAGISVQLTVNKNAAVHTLEQFLIGLEADAGVYVDLLQQHLNEEERLRKLVKVKPGVMSKVSL
jgi:hypothetical protein